MKPTSPRRITVALATFAVAALTIQTTKAAQLLYEPFPTSYTNGSSANTVVPQGGSPFPSRLLAESPINSVWTINAATGGGSAVVVGGPASLTYDGLGTVPGGSVGVYIRTNDTTGGRTRGAPFTTTSSGKLYASFLLNVEQAPSAGSRLFAQLNSLSAGTGGNAIAGVWVDQNSNLAVSKNSASTPSATTTEVITPGTTHLIVIRYTWDEADVDPVDLWLNPGSLGVSEDNVPASTITTTSGNDIASFSSFQIYHPGTEVVASLFVDEIRVGTTWADVTPTGEVCNAADVTQDPTNTVVAAGVPARFSIQAAGTSASYQWQVKTPAGGVWNNVTSGTGSNSLAYSTALLSTNDNQNQYRAIVSVACGGGSSATSGVATVTVTDPVVTPPGVVMNDDWADFSRNNTDVPMGDSNSLWWATTTANLDASSGDMVGIPNTGSTLWLGYFTTNEPVQVAIGQTIKATLEFTASNIVSNGGNSMRIGLFDYADGGSRVIADGFGGSTGNGTNVMGYMLVLNFGTNFSSDNVLSLFARNNLDSGDLMGTTGNYASLGAGPTNVALSGSPAFVSGIPYTLELSVSPTSDTAANVTVNISGNGTNWSHTVTDNTYGYRRFDAVGIRPNTIATTADSFTFSLFKVEVLATTPSAIPLNIQRSGSNVILSWANPAFALQAGTNVTGTYTNVPGASSPYTNSISAMRTFFRLKAD